jgi:hypothetical protein
MDVLAFFEIATAALSVIITVIGAAFYIGGKLGKIDTTLENIGKVHEDLAKRVTKTEDVVKDHETEIQLLKQNKQIGHA